MIYKYYREDGSFTPLTYEEAKAKVQNENAVVYGSKVYHNHHPEITTCIGCGAYVHNEQYRAQDGYCSHCYYARHRYSDSSTHYCTTCKCVHKGLCNGGLQNVEYSPDSSLSFSIRNFSKSRSAKGESKNNDKYINSIGQYQTERIMPDNIKEELENFYHNVKKFNHYYTWEPVHIEGEVSYYNYKALSTVYYEITDIKSGYSSKIKQGKQISKYYNHFLQGIDEEGLVTWKYIDIFGNIKEKHESINKFLKESGYNESNQQMVGRFRYVLSSDINHKLKAFKLNEVIRSCQRSGNYNTYAIGAYDAIANGCNCPILIYNIDGKEPFARITTRILYDKSGQEYILIDRLYHNGEFGDTKMKGTIYKSIVEDLKKKGHKVIASNYSAHDNSTYSYLASLGLKSEGEVHDLCQPLRRLVGQYGYYCDGGTEVLKGEVDGLTRATDYLDKAFIL